MPGSNEILPPFKSSSPGPASTPGGGTEFAEPSTEETRECALLTPRENDVMRCFSKGLLYKETAEVLGISYSAVHKHQHKAFLKLAVANRSEAIRRWWQMGGK